MLTMQHELVISMLTHLKQKQLVIERGLQTLFVWLMEFQLLLVKYLLNVLVFLMVLPLVKLER
jgi:hypothetical protein